MDEYQINMIMETTRKTFSGVPYQYKVNTKKRVVVLRGKSLYGQGKPQQTGMTIEIDSIPAYDI